MMQCSQLAPSNIQATHYTLLASVEVLGKLTFASICGYLADLLGYSAMFLIFVILGTAVIPLFRIFPKVLREDVQTQEEPSSEDSHTKFTGDNKDDEAFVGQEKTKTE